MRKNTTITADGIEVYTNKIYFFADEYISRLKDTESIYKSDSDQFTGLIKYINKRANFSREILADINILNDIWDIYTELVYFYNQKPTIEEFAILIGVHRDTIYSWKNEECRRDYCDELNATRSDTIKKWQDECKLGRYKSAARGNVGGIFLCKAVDGMAETTPMQTHSERPKPTMHKLPKIENGENKDFVQIEQETSFENLNKQDIV